MFRDRLAEEFRPYAELTGRQLERIERHYRLLCRWNRTLNLTRIETEDDAIRFHYCESLFLALQLPPGPLRVADFGSGAGFPGFPAAILRPDLDITLIESHQRKAVFLREASEGTPNVRVFSTRAEDVDERFDWIVARAVAPIEVNRIDLATNVALLVSRADAPRGAEIIRLPWGSERVLSLSRGAPESY